MCGNSKNLVNASTLYGRRELSAEEPSGMSFPSGEEPIPVALNWKR